MKAQKENTTSSTGIMYITFKSKMTVTEQFWSYGFLSYVAENGGFVGLFLGYSLLQLRDLIKFVFDGPHVAKILSH